MGYTKKERFLAIMNGEVPDRTPVSAWRHFPDQENDPKTFARSMVDFANRYDWDVLKLQNRGVYEQENWGNVYDYQHYKDVVPTLVRHAVDCAADLYKIRPVSPTGGTFGEQLEGLRQVKAIIHPDMPFIQTVFTPIGVLLNLCGFRSVGRYRESLREESELIRLIHDVPEAVHSALKAITETLCGYAEEIRKTGCDGIYYAALGMAREGYMTLSEWEEFAKPYDLQVLDALRPLPVILHTCGIYGNPKRFVDWPVSCLHWAESAPGNPSITDGWLWIGRKGISGGVDERPFGQGKAKEIGELARASVLRHQGHPFLLSPECSISIKTQHEELTAFRAAVEN